MKNILPLLFGLFAIFCVSFEARSETFPPDTTTKVLDKASSSYMIEEGRMLFSEGRVRDALIKFRQAAIKDPNSWKASYWVSQCHYKLNNYGYALRYAKEAISQGDEKMDSEIYYILGSIYHRLGNLDTAKINYNLALVALPKRRSKELRIEHFIQECDFAQEELKKDPAYVRVAPKGDINSGYDDYNIVLSKNGNEMYFTSRRSNTTGGGMNPDDQQYFEDVYRAKWNPTSQSWDSITNDLGRLNSDGFDAINYISPDGLYAVMTINNSAVDMRKTTRGSDLCETKLSTKGLWSTPKTIKNKSINTSYFEGAATLTADGNTMYFVTDRKGEKSSTDIYVVHKEGKSWGEAKPLPMTINTEARETTPFITPDGRYLFFSSNGHVGMGGLDIYVVENLGSTWGTPINLGSGINTVNDDTHFVYFPELKRAYIAGAEIIGDKSSIDAYEVDMTNFSFPEK